jgi:hypothetical protein
VEQVLQTQESIFGPLHAATINIPAGEKVGDIIDTSREVPILIAAWRIVFPALSRGKPKLSFRQSQSNRKKA